MRTNRRCRLGPIVQRRALRASRAALLVASALAGGCALRSADSSDRPRPPRLTRAEAGLAVVAAVDRYEKLAARARIERFVPLSASVAARGPALTALHSAARDGVPVVATRDLARSHRVVRLRQLDRPPGIDAVVVTRAWVRRVDRAGTPVGRAVVLTTRGRHAVRWERTEDEARLVVSSVAYERPSR